MEIRNTPIGMFSAAEEKTLMKTLAAATGQQANQFSLRDLQYLPIKNVSKNNISLPIHTFTKRIHVYNKPHLQQALAASGPSDNPNLDS